MSLSLSHWYPRSETVVLIVSISDLFILTYFTLCMHSELSQYYSVTAEIDVPFYILKAPFLHIKGISSYNIFYEFLDL